MVRRTDRPLRNVRVSFEVTRFSTQHLVDAYERLVPVVRRTRGQGTRAKASPLEIKTIATKTRRGEA
jgi:hypothetical protein